MKKYLITEAMLHKLQNLAMPRHLMGELDELKPLEPLIAAAPDLLEACIRMVAWTEQYKTGKSHPHDDWEFARAAITKATGETP